MSYIKGKADVDGIQDMLPQNMVPNLYFWPFIKLHITYSYYFFLLNFAVYFADPNLLNLKTVKEKFSFQ